MVGLRYKDSNDRTNLLTVSLNCLSEISLVIGPRASNTDSETLGWFDKSQWLYSTSNMMVNSVTKLSFIDVMLSFSTLSPMCSDTAIAKWPKARREKKYLFTYLEHREHQRCLKRVGNVPLF